MATSELEELLGLGTIFFISILVIAAAAIGIKCLNKCESCDTGSNKSYLQFMIGVAVLILVASVAGFVVVFRGDKTAVKSALL